MEEKDWLITLAYPTNPYQRFDASIQATDWSDAFDKANELYPSYNVVRVQPYYYEEEELECYELS